MEAKDIDFDANYTVDGYRGIAFYLKDWDKRQVLDEYGEHLEWEDCDDTVIAVMVGDDREHIVDVSELTMIEREDFCGQCGQIGCGHDGLERE